MITELKQRIERDFMYHSPKPDDIPRYEAVRAKAKELAILIADACPTGREQSLALTKVEEAVAWTNAGIARRGV